MFFPAPSLHFTGIGGIGMSALAGLCLDRGWTVSGSDLKLNPLTEALARRGAAVHQGHDARHVPAGASAVVVTTAAAADNPEVAEARARGLAVVRRGELLAELMRPCRGVAVCGSHGKTTTSALIATAAVEAGLDVTALIGGRVPQFGGANARTGAGEWFVAEADESDGSFLELSPEIAVITNVDREHLDYYGDFAAVQRAFAAFANRTAFYGTVVLCADDAHAAELQGGIRRRVVAYRRPADTQSGAEGSTFTLPGLGPVRLPVLGAHNVLNAAAAACVLREMGAAPDRIVAGLEAFRGVARRMELKGRKAGVTVLDDYGHHPSEIRATLAALRLAGPSRLVVLFQPHRYTRTQSLMDDFAACFGDADLVRITDLYAASEAPIEGISAQALASRIQAAGHPGARYTGPLEESAAALAAELRPGDLVLTLGAGSITTAGPMLLNELKD